MELFFLQQYIKDLKRRRRKKKREMKLFLAFTVRFSEIIHLHQFVEDVELNYVLGCRVDVLGTNCDQ